MIKTAIRAVLLLSLYGLGNRVASAYTYDTNIPLPVSTVTVAGMPTYPLPAGVTFTPGDNENTWSTAYAGMQFQATAAQSLRRLGYHETQLRCWAPTRKPRPFQRPGISGEAASHQSLGLSARPVSAASAAPGLKPWLKPWVA